MLVFSDSYFWLSNPAGDISGFNSQGQVNNSLEVITRRPSPPNLHAACSSVLASSLKSNREKLPIRHRSSLHRSFMPCNLCSCDSQRSQSPPSSRPALSQCLAMARKTTKWPSEPDQGTCNQVPRLRRPKDPQALVLAARIQPPWQRVTKRPLSRMVKVQKKKATKQVALAKRPNKCLPRRAFTDEMGALATAPSSSGKL